MSGSLEGKNIVLGVTGSIAAYKAAYLVRLLIKGGAQVQVVMTQAAKEFITPLTLSTLTRKPVVSEFFSARDGSWNSHVELGQWADAMVIAPCTASTLGKMAGGVADNMLCTTYFSMKAPVFIAPAMDLDMYRHPVTQRNIETLRSIGNTIIEPASGELASQLVGKGRMEEPENIVAVLEEFFGRDTDLSKKKVLITAGPTHERIDPVRFIGNDSTGKMGFALAAECARRGAQVTLIAGPVSLETPHPSIERIDVESAGQMYRQAMERFPQCDAAILCAAVADFTPSVMSDTKIKRKGEMTITLKPTQDIAASLGAIKRDGQRMVGFALETDNEFDHAQDKLQRKNLDFIVLNSLRDAGAGFGYDTNKVTLIDRNGSESLPLQSKKDVAKAIVDKLKGLLFCLLFLLAPVLASAQELNPVLTVNTSKVPGSDKDVFESLKSELTTLLRDQSWTDFKFMQDERIKCSFNLTVNKYDKSSGQMDCELTVQSSRPVYGSTYNTTVFNFHDPDVSFTYTEQDRLEYTPNAISNNLVAVFAYYCVLIVGLDFDTMSPNGGTDILRQAENIAANSQSLGSGWRSFDAGANRYSIITDYMNGSMSSMRRLMYEYHRRGLDDMSANPGRGRATIGESLKLLQQAYQAKSTSPVPVLFTEVKKDELKNIFSEGQAKEKESARKILDQINPSLSKDWETISPDN